MTAGTQNEKYSKEAIQFDSTYVLRAHHGLCLYFFKGKGYSSEFAANMADIKSRLDKNPLVRIISGTDVICSKCPNNTGARCESEAKVAEYDRQVLSRCNLNDGDIMPFYDFRKLVYQNILLPGKREEICSDCQWTSLCHFL
ncbi:MAG: DUF1284 domain-containing protein [Clostridiales bacterium]|nr:DUF1284 domain-containing protein [Clostridiales bacterium]